MGVKETRQERQGYAIAERGGVKLLHYNRSCMYFSVDADDGTGRELVVQTGIQVFCPCPDYAHEPLCKHIEAALCHEPGVWEWRKAKSAPKPKLQRLAEQTPESRTSASPKRYYPRDWPKYHADQTEEKARLMSLLQSLCLTVGGLAQKPSPGRPSVLMSDVVYAAILKVYTDFPARRFVCDLEHAEELGHVTKAVSYNSLFKYMNDSRMTEALHKLIELSSLPFPEI